MAHTLAERGSELQLLRQHVSGKEPVRTQSAGASLLKQDKQPIKVRIVHCVFSPVTSGLQRELIAPEEMVEGGAPQRMIEIKGGSGKRVSVGEKEIQVQRCCLNVLILMPPAFVTQCLLSF